MRRTLQIPGHERRSRGGWLSGLVAGGLLLAGIGLGGCSTKTETGYEPHRLGMSDAGRRALYAPAFTPEARAADNDKQNSLNARKPGGGAGAFGGY